MGQQRSYIYIVYLHVQQFFRLFFVNFHDASEGIKLIKSIDYKNNNYLLMDRAYENDKIFTLAKDHVVPLKKNRKFLWLYDEQLYKQQNIIERYFLRLKRFRKVFTRYDKLYSIFVSTIYLYLFSICFLCEHCLSCTT